MRQICQTCLFESNTPENFTSLFDINDNLSKILHECASVQIVKSDDCLICHTCRTILLEFNRFKQRCIEARSVIQSRKHSDCEDSGCVILTDDSKLELNDTPKIPLACYACPYCADHLLTKRKLQDHLRVHTENDEYTCVYCATNIRRLGQLTKHFNVKHSDEMPRIKCVQCGDLFHVDAQLQFHKTHAHALAKCPSCGEEFATKPQMERHLTKKHPLDAGHYNLDRKDRVRNPKVLRPRKKVKIEDLVEIKPDLDEVKMEDVKYTDRTVLRLYDRERVKCPLCSDRFLTVAKLEQHIGKQHADWPRKVKCDACDKLFYTTHHLAIHMHDAHKCKETRNICSVCGLRTANARNLSRHKARVHAEDAKPHVCRECGTAFPNALKLSSHTLTHTRERTKDVCNICGLMFAALKDHMSNIHLKSVEERKMRCRYKCGLTCETRVELTKHYRQEHEKELLAHRRYKCSACDKCFTHRALFRNHYTYQHANVRMHACTLCAKSFKRPYALKCHMRLHTDDRPYACTACDKCFRSSTTRAMHQLTHTGEKPHACNVCGRKFTQRSALRTHLRGVHKVDAAN